MASTEHQLRIGDRVRVLEQNPAGNPRTPPYIHGKRIPFAPTRLPVICAPDEISKKSPWVSLRNTTLRSITIWFAP